MGHYVVRRLLQAIPLMVIVSIVLFALVNLAPGGPLAGRGQSRTPRPEQVAILKRQFGLDQPLWKRYIFWLVGNDWTKVDTDGDVTMVGLCVSSILSSPFISARTIS